MHRGPCIWLILEANAYTTSMPTMKILLNVTNPLVKETLSTSLWKPLVP